jgi:peptidoglycan hydrolase-like protein with peptidoglycan-binding domain
MADEAPAELKKPTLSEPVEDKKFDVVADEIAPAVVEEIVEEVAPSEVVEVFEDKIVYLNKRHKKSMSVWQVQRRLYDLGYKIVKKAKPGYYEELTQEAVEAFRAEKKLGAGSADAKFLKALFADDKTVKLILS